MSVIRDKLTILITLTIVGVWNSNILSISLHLSLSCPILANEGVKDFAFLVGAYVE